MQRKMEWFHALNPVCNCVYVWRCAQYKRQTAVTNDIQENSNFWSVIEMPLYLLDSCLPLCNEWHMYGLWLLCVGDDGRTEGRTRRRRSAERERETAKISFILCFSTSDVAIFAISAQFSIWILLWMRREAQQTRSFSKVFGLFSTRWQRTKNKQTKKWMA